jgi:5-formyltetrahydrofolate cyclo-ligase
MKERKEKLRQEIKNVRQNLTEAERNKKNETIQTALAQIPEFKAAKTVLAYVSTPEEVDTHNLIKGQIGKKKIVIPCVVPSENSLRLSQLNHWNDLTPGAYNILELPPEKQDLINETQIDLIIVPGIAFDSQGNRIGYGKGYYDRLLKRINAPTIALAYDCQIVKNISPEDHDHPIDTILTETRVLKS